MCTFFSIFINAATPQDLGVVDKEKILYWLKKDKPLSEEDLAIKYAEFINFDAAKNHNALSLKYGFKHPSLHVIPPSNITKTRSAPTSLISDEVNNTLDSVKVLAILIDFPDLSHDDNKLNETDTDMYYSQYPVSHYQQLLFSESGYTGPNGENLQTAFEYYKAASGNSLQFTGDVFGWVTADHQASTYGARLGTQRDIAAPDLVKEAVEKAVEAYDIDLSEYDLTDLDDIDGDGIINEPNGIIDHVVIFHSSIGEEAGGGYLSTDAIWSHQYYVLDDENQPTSIANSDVKVFGYTINPIDAAIGVVVHEFGHALGLADEYDLRPNSIGEPVANWSVMSNGTYGGALSGTEPVMFSAFALDYLQNRYQGNWVNQLTLSMRELDERPEHTLTHAANTDTQLSQIKLLSEKTLEAFKTPVEGNFQYYSGTGDNVTHRFTQTITLPSTDEALTLAFVAFYSIEKDYDFVQVKVNSQPIEGNYTESVNPYYGNIGPYISGDSFSNGDAQQPNNYLNYSFDLSSYNGQTITLSVEYYTDTTTHYYGFVFDDAKITQSDTVIWQDNAESLSSADLSGFSRISSYIYAPDTHYYLQLRAHLGIDSGLQNEAYSPGLLLWFSSQAYDDNNVTTHPGSGFALIVDADQQQINQGTTTNAAATSIQIRDAAFSLYDQTPGLGDTELSAISQFSDADDYSFAVQPESGVVLPANGFNFNIIEQASNSESITIALNYDQVQHIQTSQQDKRVTFTVENLNINAADTLLWDFGDGEFSEQLTPTHDYSQYGTYDISFAATDAEGVLKSAVATLTVAESFTIEKVNYQVDQSILSASVELTGGQTPFSYLWQLGDETQLSDAVISHQYLLSGEYTILLTVTDNAQQSASHSFIVNVEVPLQLDAQVAVSDKTASFSAQIAGGYGQYSYHWDFGDGNEVSNSQNPSHTYINSGRYNAKVTITDTTDNKTITKTVAVDILEQTTVEKKSSSSGSLQFMLIVLLMGWVFKNCQYNVRP
nr:immune inhibitor A domain-containing protein [Pseudoalteromonas sp. MMG010]